MSIVLRIFLVVVAIMGLGVVMAKVRKRGIRVADSVYWVACALLLVVLAVFPQIAFFFSELLGFLSPSNFVFCLIIGLMLLKLFNLASDVSRLTNKVEELAQELALYKKDNEEQGLRHGNHLQDIAAADAATDNNNTNEGNLCPRARSSATTSEPAGTLGTRVSLGYEARGAAQNSGELEQKPSDEGVLGE